MQCSSHNFRRRDVCFTCQLPRSHSKSLVCSEDGSDFVGNAPCNTLVIRGLDAFTQEQDILRVFESACEVKIRQAHVMRQEDTHLSKGYALVEFLNVADAYKVIQEIKSKQFFEISGKAVQVDYSKNTFTTIMSTLRSEGSFNAKFYAERNEIQQIKSSLNTASAMALAESALLRHHNNTKVSSVLSQAIKAQPYTPPVVNNPPVMPFNAATCHLVTYPFPDTTKFIFDEPTRYFYDSHTGLLYDPNSKYFFDRQTQGYFYFDQTRYQYIPVTQQLASNIVSQEPAPPGIPPPPTNVLNDPIQSHLDEAKAEVKEMKKREEKDKKARQIARDMEKWAKRMNSMKDTAAGGKSAKDDFNNKDTGSKTADMAFKMLEKKSAVETYQPTKSASVAKAFVDDDDEDDEGTVKPESSRNNSPDNNSMDSETLVAEEEKSLIDWNKLACLLCSRGFKDNATLTKHTSTSSLHLENLNKLRLKYNLLPLSSLQEKETHSLEYLMKLGAQKAVGHDASTRKLSTLDSQNYRDRAHERRMRHGFGDPAGVPNVPVPIVDPCLAAGPILEMPPEKPMDNVGNKLLAKMGWEEGQGLGKSNQGRTELIEPEMRQMGVGLGNANSRKHGLPGDDYKANVKKSMYARYYSVK